jgi:hypothetical protein
MGSNTKVFAATVVLQLVGEHRLGLDDSLGLGWTPLTCGGVPERGSWPICSGLLASLLVTLNFGPTQVAELARS